MEIKEALITPATAAKWLEIGNVNNRAVRDRTVERYARDMKAGLWRLTHQGIAFGPNNELLDGQHRLWAIVESDVPIRMMVARGVNLDAQTVIDDNLPRSAGDAIKFRTGANVRSVELAIAKRILLETLHTQASRQETIRVFTKHREAIGFAASCFTRMVRGVTTAAVMTPIARAFYSVEHDRLQRFAEILTDGRLDSKDEDAALTLRNWLMEGALVKAGTSREMAIYGKTERALYAFLRGERITNLYAATTELFPIPEDLAEPRILTTRKVRTITAAGVVQSITRSAAR
jgi:hypothetical protein